MYDEVNQNHENDESGAGQFGKVPEPIEPENKEFDNVTQEELHAEEMIQQEENPEENNSPGESPSFYHYSYDRTQEQTREDTQDIFESKPGKSLKGTIWPKLAVSAAVALVFGVVGGASFTAVNYMGGKLTSGQTEAKIELAGTVNSSEDSADAKVNAVPVSASGADISQVVSNCMPSIVAITTVSVQQIENMFFGTTEQEAEGSGSGIIVAQNDSELLIATNNHVVEGANTLSVCFTVDVDENDIKIVEGQIKGTDPSKDLAIVAVELKDIPDEVKNQIKVVEMGDSEGLKVGEQVVAIGNALGYGQSVTVGYVSALNREVTVDNLTNNLIQTDAAINFGNSGGALLNTKGQLVGINSVKAAATGVEGMGYAIPISTASPILSDLMNRTTRTKAADNEKGYMGVTLADVSNEAKEIYNMPSGAFIYSIEEGSAAEKAGMKKGDIITKFDGITVTGRDEMLSRMEYYKVGETVDAVVQSANSGEYQERTVSITLDKRPASADKNPVQPGSESQTPGNEQQIPDQGQQIPGDGQDGSQGSGAMPFQDLFPEFFGE